MTEKNNVAVVGLGKSGMAAVRFFKKKGYEVFASDSKELDPKHKIVQELKSLGVQAEFGGHTQKVLESNLIIVSPGVLPDIPVLEEAKRRKIPVWPEIEAAYRFCPGPIIAVTGTNGKSTVAALAGHLLKENGIDARVVGNIGVPLLDEIDSMNPSTWAVMEVSSFQLETITEFRPKIACIMMITQDHLNRHPNLDAYVAAKAKILQNQKSDDTAILNYDDPVTQTLADRVKGKLVWFSMQKISEGVFNDRDSILYRRDGKETEILKIKNFPLPGKHNIQNLTAAAAICHAAGLTRIEKGIDTFKSLPHRLTKVTSIHDIEFYDDSKATNPDAAATAIRTFKKPVVLIAGGYDKNLDLTPMADAARDRVKALVALGKDTAKIIDAFKFLPGKQRIPAADMREAVQIAFGMALPGDVILLSPGSASFDLFNSAEERGDRFQESVLALAKEKR